MKSSDMWCFYMMLSNHMWDDELTSGPGSYLTTEYEENINTDVKVWDNLVDFVKGEGFNSILIDVGDGIKYERRPEISAPNAWEKDFLKKKLDYMRSIGITPIPKLNFAAGHDTWLKKYRRMVSTPEYYGAAADCISEICELFGYPEYFHIGFDEEIPVTQSRYEMTVVRGKELWWHDFLLICRECEKHGARPWIWSDSYWFHKEEFIKRMPKSVLQSNWYYNRIYDYSREDLEKANGSEVFNSPARRINTYIELDELGYEQVPTASSCADAFSVYQTMRFCKENISEGGLRGFLSVPWTATTDESEHFAMYDAHKFYLNRKRLFPESFD